MFFIENNHSALKVETLVEMLREEEKRTRAEVEH